MKRVVILISFALVFLGCAQFHTQTQDTRKAELSEAFLQSWRDGAAKEQIRSFVEEVTTEGSAYFVPENQRRAFFDMDGTLLCEKPNYIEVVLAERRLLEKTNTDPTLAEKPIYKAILSGDIDYLYKHVKEVITEAFAGETLESYINFCRNFLETQTHPRFNRSYASLFYLPMLELVKYLQNNGFTVYVVSTSQQEFIRSISEDRIGVPPQQIIGTMVGFTLANLNEDSPPVFIRDRSYFDPYNADNNKVIRMRERALLPAMFAFGNSMGDYAMLDAVSDSNLPSLVCILDHDDAKREYDYHKETLLKEAQSRNWLIVSMKKDFLRVFESE
jgi:phosphoserine phosphatase